MEWPQISYVALVVLSVGFAIGKHGRPRKWNMWETIIDAIVALFLLSKGGFFS